MGTLRTSDLGVRTDTWMGDSERRERFFGWTDAQVAALYIACERELAERHVTLQEDLGFD